MLRVAGAILLIALYIYFAIEVLTTPKQSVRTLPKAVWLVVVLLIPVVGGVLWFFAGRPRRGRGPRFGGRRRTVAPDDDPNFLRRLDEEAWRERMKRRRGQSDDGQPEGGAPEGA